MFLTWKMSKTQSRWQNQMAYVLFLKTNPIFSDENAFKISIINIMVGCNFWRFDANKFWMTDRKHEREVERGRCCGQQCSSWNSETVAGTIYWHTATQADPSSRQSRRSTSPTQGDGVGPSIPTSPACTCCCDKTFFVYIPRDIETGVRWSLTHCVVSLDCDTALQSAPDPCPDATKIHTQGNLTQIWWITWHHHDNGANWTNLEGLF